jgi:hypothetical protein
MPDSFLISNNEASVLWTQSKRLSTVLQKRHLHHERIPYSQDAMDMGQIESKLRQFFGVASPVIIQLIYEKFMMRVVREGYFSADMIPMLDKLPKNSNTDTIFRLVAQHRKSH